MIETRDHFSQRLTALRKKHKKMTHGYTTRVGKDGLVVVTPRRRNLMPGTAGLKVLMMVAVGFVGFKTFTLAAVGPVTYNERLSQLENGSALEQVGAKALAIDPVTETLAESVGPVMR